MPGSIATAYVQVIPSMQGVKGTLEKGFGAQGSSSGSLFGSKLVKTAVGVIASAKLGQALWATLNEGAALEQSLGGVETLFKDSAKKVTDNAKVAWKSAGLSANQYMELATTFSASLLQGLSGDTREASRITDMAIKDMSDNINKFGSTAQSVQDAYKGFAKQNYTMLDNLKLGYGGTKTEMERLLKDAQKLTGVKYDISNLADVYSAIHAIQENLEITGTTAKEAASTFAGSFSAMKAAAKNVLGNLMLGENIKPSLIDLTNAATTFLIGNFLPAVKNVIFALPDVILTLGGSIADAILGVFGTDLQTVISELETIFAPLKEALSGLFSTVSETVRPLVDAFREYVSSGKAMADVTSTIRTILEGLVSVLSTVVNWISQFITWLNSGSTGAQVFKAVVIGIATAFASWKIISTVVTLITSVVTAVVNAVAWIKSFGSVLGLAKAAIAALGGPVTVAIAAIAGLVAGFIYLWNTCEGFRQFFISMGQAIVSAWNATVSWIGQAAMSVASFFTNTIPQAFQSMVAGFQSAVSQLVTLLNQVIANVASWAVSMGQKAVEAAAGFVRSLVNGLASLPSTMYQIGSSIVTGIWNGISAGWNWLTSQVSNLAKSLFQAAKNALGINSPSKVFRDGVGRWIPAGIAAGIRDYSGLVTSAMDDLTAQTQADFNAALRVNAPRGGAGGWQSPQNGRVVNFVQNVYAQAQTAAELAQETRYQAEMKVLLGV